MLSSSNNLNSASWYVMRDLKRANTRHPAFQLFMERDLEVFTPMKWKLGISQGKRVRRLVPCIPDLLFVHESRETLDPIVEEIPTVQYRWVRGKYREPMKVPDTDMERFIRVARSADSPRYYLPEEITPAMLNRRIRIVGGVLDGCEGTLVTVRGSKVKRLLVELPNLLAVGVEVSPDYIQFL